MQCASRQRGQRVPIRTAALARLKSKCLCLRSAYLDCAGTRRLKRGVRFGWRCSRGEAIFTEKERTHPYLVGKPARAVCGAFGSRTPKLAAAGFKRGSPRGSTLVLVEGCTMCPCSTEPSERVHTFPSCPSASEPRARVQRIRPWIDITSSRP